MQPSTCPVQENLIAHTFHDESVRANVMLGGGFAMRQAKGKQVAARGRAQNQWHSLGQLLLLRVVSATRGEQEWQLLVEAASGIVPTFRTRLEQADCQEPCLCEIRDDFELVCAPAEPDQTLPDSVFGCMIGAATGLMEAKNLILSRERRKRDEDKGGHEMGSDWRAPRFSFAMRTATGSPFVERWGFAIQEAVHDGGFRVWIEQQRTGREIHIRPRSDGGIEGLHELEQLPAAVHGAGLGMARALERVSAYMEETSAYRARIADFAHIAD